MISSVRRYIEAKIEDEHAHFVGGDALEGILIVAGDSRSEVRDEFPDDLGMARFND